METAVCVREIHTNNGSDNQSNGRCNDVKPIGGERNRDRDRNRVV